MLVGVDVVLTVGFLGFVFAVVLLLCLFAIISKLSGIQKTMRGILAHQRFANGWPAKEYGQWTVLDRTFKTEAEARAFIAEHRQKAMKTPSEPTKPTAPSGNAPPKNKRRDTDWKLALPPGYVDR